MRYRANEEASGDQLRGHGERCGGEGILASPCGNQAGAQQPADSFLFDDRLAELQRGPDGCGHTLVNATNTCASDKPRGDDKCKWRAVVIVAEVHKASKHVLLGLHNDPAGSHYQTMMGSS